jgi:cation diffusion facilitator family transporter
VHEGSRRAVLVAFAANFGVAIAKFVGFSITGATSMLAEGVHSIADTGNQLLLLLGDVRSRRRPTPEHPFGYGRERYFWAFVVAVVLFMLGSVFAISEGIDKLRHPHELQSAGWAIGILVVAFGLEATALRTAVRESRTLKGEQSWWQFIRHAKVAALPVILLEDMGALLGLTIALVCIGLTMLTGNPVWDAIGSLGIGVLLGLISALLGFEMKSLLIGESATPRMQAAIRDAIERHPSVRRLIHLRTQHLGPEELLIGAKVGLDASLTLAEVATIINELEAEIRRNEPVARVIYIEPDVLRADPE